MRTMHYFPHDSNARGDEKIIRLISILKWEGYGLYWALIEKLHESGGWLSDDQELIAFDLRCSPQIMSRILNEFGLFIKKDGRFTSKRVLKNIQVKKEKSTKASESSRVRWQCERNANAMRTQCDGNARKERNKRKEIKESHRIHIDIPEDLKDNTPEIQDWLEYKKQRGQSYKPKGLEALWRSFRAIPPEKRREAVDHSMSNNWSGLFEKKSFNPSPTPPLPREVIG